ncbi:amylo-alpha-1,6-glucosidase, partial [Actinoallomurus acaciae]
MQAYAYQAAVLGADLLEAYGRDGERHRRWARGLAARFRARFWLEEGYPAIALDGTGAPVDGLASNAGHLLGTGLLDRGEEARVARRLGELDSGWGLRTLTGDAAG